MDIISLYLVLMLFVHSISTIQEEEIWSFLIFSHLQLSPIKFRQTDCVPKTDVSWELDFGKTALDQEIRIQQLHGGEKDSRRQKAYSTNLMATFA